MSPEAGKLLGGQGVQPLLSCGPQENRFLAASSWMASQGTAGARAGPELKATDGCAGRATAPPGWDAGAALRQCGWPPTTGPGMRSGGFNSLDRGYQGPLTAIKGP